MGHGDCLHEAARRCLRPTGQDVAVPAETLWTPSADAATSTRLGRFLTWVEQERGLSFDGYQNAWRWSVEDLAGFWSAVSEYFEVDGLAGHSPVLASKEMPGARWYPDTAVNYAATALRLNGVDDYQAVVISHSQTRPAVALTGAELRDQVGRARTGLADLGVGRGDRVAAYMPNLAETVVAFLATASLGAVWTSCAPEFGIRSVVERLQQVEPKVLLTVDGYRYGAKAIDRTPEVAAIRAALPTLAATVVVPYLSPESAADRIPGSVPWSELVAEAGPLEFEPVPFDHPLYVLYSSGTTGLPKPIVHGHGGMLLEHIKALALHSDLGPGDRFLWFSTTGWMMWNFLVSGLLVGASIVLFDGDPGWPDLTTLWRLVAETATTYFGSSAPFLLACRKAGLRFVDDAEIDLSALRSVGSTGAPLPADGFGWVYEAVSPNVQLASVSGGTDVCTAFVGMSPLLPVRAGEISCRYLGAAVESFDQYGQPVVGRQGELVITEPMPSMPVGFWGDEDGDRYRAAYFERFPGVWCHGDWITVAQDGSCVITGRSDATLNRGGVRLGTSEFYSVVEALPEVADSLVVHLEGGDDAGGGAGQLVLFVVPAPGTAVDDALRSRIAAALRSELSPRHVPDAIHAVAGVPRTLSGKKLEVPVKRILSGAAVDDAASLGALANPEVFAAYQALARS